MDENERRMNGAWEGSIPFGFLRLPVVANDIAWAQWFGPTEFAFEHSEEYGYSQGFHAALDCGVPAGTPVYSTQMMSGTVNRIRSTLHGLAVYVQYGDMIVIYQHIESTLNIDDIVYPGDIVGTVVEWKNPDGTNNSHLHLEIRNANQSRILNPLMFIREKDIDSLLSHFLDPNEFADEHINGDSDLDYAYSLDNPLAYLNVELVNGEKHSSRWK